MRRDITRIHQHLIQQKRILLLGDAGDETALSMNDDDLKNTRPQSAGTILQDGTTIAINIEKP